MQDESIMRKKYFNMMEDMKGKIRVYARVRPMLEFERSRGQKEALIIPDELSLEHMWKDKKREYSFDAVFSSATPQEKVPFQQTVSILVVMASVLPSWSSARYMQDLFRFGSMSNLKYVVQCTL